MAITAQQLADLRADFGDTAETVFTDAEIERLWERANGAASDTQRHEATLGLMFRQVLNQAHKLHDYKAGDVTQDLSQVRKHLLEAYKMYADAVDAALGQSRNVAMISVRTQPHQLRRKPYTQLDDDNNGVL